MGGSQRLLRGHLQCDRSSKRYNNLCILRLVFSSARKLIWGNSHDLRAAVSLLVLQKGHSHGDPTMRGCCIHSAFAGAKLRPPLWRKKGGNTWLLRSRLDLAINSVSIRHRKRREILRMRTTGG